MNPAEEYVDARLKQAIGDCFTWKDGLPLMKKRPKNARYITIDRMSQPMAAVPLKDLPGATKNMTLAPQQTMVPYVRDKLFSCEEKRLCLGGFYISNDGSHVVGLAMLGSLLYFGETTQPMTSMSPLRMSAKSINSSFAGLDMAWMHAVIESLVAMNTVKASGDAGLLKPNPYRDDRCVSSRLSVLQAVLTDPARVQILSTLKGMNVPQQSKYLNDFSNTTFGLSHGGHAVAVKLWGLDSESASGTRHILGYIPVKNFSSFILMGCPLLAENELADYLKISALPFSKSNDFVERF